MSLDLYVNVGHKRIGPQALGAFFDGNFLKTLGDRLDQQAKLSAHWLSRAPESFAGRAWPTDYRDGILRLSVETPAWASRMRHSQAAIVKSLRRDPFYRGLRAIKLQVRPPGSSVPSARATDSRPPTRLTPKVAALVRAVADEINDPKLRDALKRLGAHGLDKNTIT